MGNTSFHMGHNGPSPKPPEVFGARGRCHLASYLPSSSDTSGNGFWWLLDRDAFSLAGQQATNDNHILNWNNLWPPPLPIATMKGNNDPIPSIYLDLSLLR